MRKHAFRAGTFLLSFVLALVAIGVSLGVSHAAPEDDIESAFMALVDAWNSEDLEAFAGHFNEEGIADQFYGLSGAEALEAIAGDRMALGPMIGSSISSIEVTGNDATAEVEIEFEAGLSLYEEWEFHLVDDSWVAGPGTTLYRPLPAGVTAVPLTLQEYSFDYDRAAVAGGNFGLEVTNAGAEEHEVVVVALGPTGTTSDLVDAVLETEELPEWAELVTIEFFEPGVSGTVILPGPLAVGRYAFACFLPSPDETPHAVLGMVSEFTVGAGTGMTPPSTGDAGVAEAGEGGPNYALLLALAVGLTLAVILLVESPGRSRVRGRASSREG